MGALPAVLGLVVLCVVFSILRPVVPHRRQLRQPVHPGRGGHRSSRWAWSSSCCSARSTSPPASPAASAPRCWPMLLTMHGCPGTSPCCAAIVTGAVIGAGARHAGRQGRHPVLRGHPRRVPRLPGRRAAADQGAAPTSRSATRCILAIANQNLPPWLGWALFAVARRRLRRRCSCCGTAAGAARGLIADPLARGRCSGSARWPCSLGAAVYVLNLERSRNVADHLAQGRADRGADHRGAAGRAGRSCSSAPATAGTSTRSAATARRPAGPASTSTGSGSPSFVICSDDGGRRRHRGGVAGPTRSTRTPAAATCCSTRSARRSSAAPASSAARAGSSTPCSAARWSRSSTTAWA